MTAKTIFSAISGRITMLAAVSAMAMTALCAQAGPSQTTSSATDTIAKERLSRLNTVVRKVDATERLRMLSDQKVLVGADTVSIILPDKNFGRYDRGLYNYLYIPKSKWAFGLTANYGEFNSEDIQLLDIITNFNFKGKLYSIHPTVSYFIRHNQSIGLKATYSRGSAYLGDLSVDFDDDLNFDLHNVSYVNETYAMGVFYRNYVGLDRGRRFGLFNEVDLMFQTGASRFKRTIGGELRDTRTNITQASLNFSPGVCCFLQENLAFNISFGVFGLRWRHEKQTTNGEFNGSRSSSGANFRFNIFNINFGLMVVI